MAEIESEMRDALQVPGRDDYLEESATDVASIVGAAASVGALAFSAVQARYARASYLLQRDSTDDYDPGFTGNDDYDPGFAGQDDYDPGFSGQVEPVLDLTLDDDLSYGCGGQEYSPGFEDLDY